METIAELLKARIEASRNSSATLMDQLTNEGKEYNKKWAEAVQYFQKAINQERTKRRSPFPQLPFVAIRTKLEHIREISDLRWFYGQCLRYSRKKGNEYTFERCFFGALKIREIVYPQKTHIVVRQKA